MEQVVRQLGYAYESSSSHVIQDIFFLIVPIHKSQANKRRAANHVCLNHSLLLPHQAEAKKMPNHLHKSQTSCWYRFNAIPIHSLKDQGCPRPNAAEQGCYNLEPF